PDARELEKLPDSLDPAAIHEDAFLRLARKSTQEAPWELYRLPRLAADLDRVADLSDEEIRHLLQLGSLPAHPGLLELSSRGLKLDPAISFGKSPVHQQLTPDQLEALARLHPTLTSNLRFIQRRLASLREYDDATLLRDPRLHARHLARLNAAAVALPPALISLKAHILFHHLRLQRETGTTDPETLAQYLAIPRRDHPLIRPTKDELIRCASPEEDFSAITACPPVHDDSPLLEALLLEALAGADTPAAFAPFIEASALTRLHARARLLSGGDPGRWGKLLEPSDFAALRDLTLLDFAPGRPQTFGVTDATTLTLDLKNTPELQIRIHELDLPAILRRDREQPTAAFDLAGLVPHHTRTVRFDQAPLIVHREKISLPEITGPGAWIVEFVSGNHACRALIRKGTLNPRFTRTATGYELSTFDENGNSVPQTTLDFSTASHTSDPQGIIHLPDSPTASSGPAILRSGPLATMVDVPSRSPDLALKASFHLDREQLRADATATARLATSLTNHGHPLPLDHLENARLTLSSTLISGITTEHVISDSLKLAPQLAIPFQVPAGATEITFTLSATVRPDALSGGKPAVVTPPAPLTARSSFTFNSLLLQSFTHARFTHNSDGWFLEVRGRNGEPLADRAIDLKFAHIDYAPRHSITLRLRTAADGRIRLGALDAIASVRASLAHEHLATAHPTSLASAVQPPHTIVASTGETLSIPLDPPLDRTRYTLTRHLGEITLRDHFTDLSAAAGSLLIAPLPAGSYRLSTPGGTVAITITGKPTADGIDLPATSITASTRTRFPALASIAADASSLTLEIAHASPTTRVHLIGTRFLRANHHDAGLLPASPPLPSPTSLHIEPCGYLTGRTLDPETRYILDRRTAKTFPGAMLPRPGLLTQRWFDDDLDPSLLPAPEGAFGDLSAKRGDGSAGGAFGADPFASGSSGGSGTPDHLDYLDRSSVVRYDLTPAADGKIVVPLATFEGCHGIDAIVTDTDLLHRRRLALADSPLPLRDRRLARPLDPAKHHLATRRATALNKDDEVRIENMLDADWRAFTTLAEAHALLYATTGDERLRELAGMLDWHEFDETSKLAFWTDHACHELHLFISRRDPDFFGKHVKPMLSNKREPAFIDDYLLGRDLTAYLRPFAWNRLNAAEKALLAQALPAARDRIASDLTQRWEIEAPLPEDQTRLFLSTLRSDESALTDSLGLAGALRTRSAQGSGAAYILEKLNSIILPVIDFEDIALEEAIDFLRTRALEIDTTELDPTKKGMSFVLRRPRNPDGDLGDSNSIRIPELRLRNVPISEALNYICEATRMRWSVDDFAITITPATEVAEDLFTRTFQLPPDFMTRLSGGTEAQRDIDPFAPESDIETTRERKSIVELLKENGVEFPGDASAEFIPSSKTLLVRNTSSNLDLVEQIVNSCMSAAGSPNTTATGRPVNRPAPAPARYAAASSWSGNRLQTKLWLESNYDKHSGFDTGESLIPLNAFWLDLARSAPGKPFLSPHFNACTTSHNDSLMCLALLDLPFTADRPDTSTDGPSLRVKARAPMLLFYKDTRETDQVAQDSPVLARQTYYRLDDRFRTETGRKIENTLTDGFRTGIAYGCSLVVTNPTGTGRRIDVLAQIPAGAIAISGKEATLADTRELEPYGVLTFDLAFYFPQPGNFSAYPLQVAENEIILTHTPARTLQVNDADPASDASSWPVIARDGTAPQVLDFLAKANLHTIDLSLITWRMRDREFYTAAIALLQDRLIVPASLSRYAFLHADLPTIGLWLENSSHLQQLGDFLESPLLDIHPATHLGWRSLEFDPLVNPRAHPFADQSRIRQQDALTHYREFLRILGWKAALTDEDQLHFTWFLFIQDRIDEAIQRFATIRPDHIANRLAYDYLHTLVLFHQAKPRDAAEIARRHQKLPPGPWRERFQAVIDQADEIASLTQSNQAGDADPEPDDAPDLAIESTADGDLLLRHSNLDEAGLSIYQIDLELLFSRNPFLEDAGELPGTRPNLARTVKLEGEETRVPLPPDMRRGNILVAANAAGGEILSILDSRALDIQCRRQNPVLQVRSAGSGSPLATAYVKVYVETDGEPVFHKDGYTDLRGKFDFLTLSDGSQAPTGRIAILVTHPDHGTRTLVLD
ncbi:MAG: hypothetical protein RLZ97_2351, partial [Verrucomicrobiota bacterium]